MTTSPENISEDPKESRTSSDNSGMKTNNNSGTRLQDFGPRKTKVTQEAEDDLRLVLDWDLSFDLESVKVIRDSDLSNLDFHATRKKLEDINAFQD